MPACLDTPHTPPEHEQRSAGVCQAGVRPGPGDARGAGPGRPAPPPHFLAAGTVRRPARGPAGEPTGAGWPPASPAWRSTCPTPTLPCPLAPARPSQALSNTLWGLSKLGIQADELMEAIGRAARSQLYEYNSQNLANSVREVGVPVLCPCCPDRQALGAGLTATARPQCLPRCGRTPTSTWTLERSCCRCDAAQGRLRGDSRAAAGDPMRTRAIPPRAATAPPRLLRPARACRHTPPPPSPAWQSSA